jgi:hypothetical protein
MSDGEEDGEGGNELVYDDFFLQDNDFGSDAGSDGEGMAAANIISRRNHNVQREHIGPFFIYQSDIPLQLVEGVQVPCEGSGEIDTQKLRNYPVYFHSTKLQFPNLGAEEKIEPISPDGIDPLPTNSTDDADKKIKSVMFKDNWVPELVQHIHGQKISIDKLTEEFWAVHPETSKAQIKKKIQSIAQWQRPTDSNGNHRWMVNADSCAMNALEVNNFH